MSRDLSLADITNDEDVENNYSPDVVPDCLNPYSDKVWEPRIPTLIKQTSDPEVKHSMYSPRTRAKNHMKHKKILSIEVSQSGSVL
jgi:hypothetical protein